MKRLNKSQVVCLTAMTGNMLMHPVEFIKEISKRFGREVQKEEIQTDAFVLECRKVYADELRYICDYEEDSGIVVVKQL